jgi:hypothetical protein
MKTAIIPDLTVCQSKKNPTVGLILKLCVETPRGYKEMSSIFADQYSALVLESQCGGGGGCGVSANEYSCAHHVTWSPNKLWRSTSIFNL